MSGKRRLAQRWRGATQVEEESRGRETVGRSLCAGGSAASAMAMARERRDMVVAMARGGRLHEISVREGGAEGKKNEGRRRS